MRKKQQPKAVSGMLAVYTGNVSSAEVYREAVAIISQRTADGKHLTAEYRSVIHNDQLIGHSVQDSQRSENAARNRYINVLPYDFNRVLLRDGQQQYVNASYVRQADRNLGGELNYLATQGPLPSTVADFWRMVYEQQVPTVIMLTNVTERGIVKCHPYYPDKPGDNLTPGKDIQVACLSSAQHHDGQITDRSLQVRVGTGPPVMVRQLCFHAWPDHGAPNDSTVIRTVSKLLHREGSVHQSTSPLPQPAAAAAAAAAQQGAGSVSQLPATATVSLGAGQQDGNSSAGSPLAAPLAVVHCSAGIGRTGTFIAVDIVRQRLHHLAAQAGSGTMSRHVAMRLLAEALDVPTLVHELRQQRMGMVQTFEQYAFIYQALLEELQASLDSSPDADVQPAKDAIDTAGGGAGAAAAAPSKAVKRGW
ncbi:protein-tyrosine phosphatase-like protein [Haematococcus lacustris]